MHTHTYRHAELVQPPPLGGRYLVPSNNEKYLNLESIGSTRVPSSPKAPQQAYYS